MKPRYIFYLVVSCLCAHVLMLSFLLNTVFFKSSINIHWVGLERWFNDPVLTGISKDLGLITSTHLIATVCNSCLTGSDSLPSLKGTALVWYIDLYVEVKHLETYK